MVQKLNMKTKDLADENFKILSKLFPNAVTEIKNEEGIVVRAIDADVLRQEINKEVIEGKEERYQFTWPDKKKSVILANKPSTKTLKLDTKSSFGRNGEKGSIDTQNIYIEGDNLEALKLLHETYLGKIKMIYIDPPYNTGNDLFVYDDDYSKSRDEYLEESGQFDEVGNQLVRNPESNGRFHTDWLNMMYPRLRLAKDLLTEDGVIFISIDDNEVENLKKICNEVFGARNFVNCIAIKMSEATGVKMNHAKIRFPKLKEYILFYKRDNFQSFVTIDKYKSNEWDKENNMFLDGMTRENRDFLIKLTEKEVNNQEDVIKANGVLSKVKIVSLSEKIKELSFTDEKLNDWLFDNSYRIIKTAGSDSLAKIVNKLPQITNQDIASAISSSGVIFFYITNYNRNTSQPRLRVIFADENIYKNPCDFWQDIKTSGAIAKEGGVDYHNGKKPLKLLNRIIKMTTKNTDIIMDFFSGSASTAHAVMKLNAEDGANRKFIMVQLDDNLDESLKKSEGEAKTTVKETINFLDSIDKPHILSELGKERIRRAGIKIKEESPLTTQNLDIGFRVFKVDESNMKDVYYAPNELEQEQLDIFESNIKDGVKNEDLLIQVMLELGVELSENITKEKIDGKEILVVSDNFLIASFDNNLTSDVITKIAKRKPEYAVFKDSSYASDTVFANYEQIFETYSQNTKRKVI
ncbi:MAG: site-specific DNA-methyltransferase [Bdellovibrionota bacterium]|nr:site-specific DNA-methyltransferase [Pseudomonadota bacterium]MDY6090646.1 site-specific DNA-methyltransferase [Bdellovibrionota bacterium]